MDVAEASDLAFGPDTHTVYAEWDGFRAWADSADLSETARMTFAATELGSPSPAPRQVFAIGLNYGAHAAESGFAEPVDLPPTFTKFASSLSGPDTVVTLPAGGNTDWEVELVVVIGRTAHQVGRDEAWDYVAGVTVGQDLSERIVQLRGPAPQFGLGKSFPGFAPVGPWLVTPDELADRDDLALGCAINGETVQDGRTRDLIFPVARLVSELTQVVELYPGDLIFTGTPAGVGIGRDPQRFLQPGDELVSWIEGVGELRQKFVE
ncbi:fumarylacetoacetate hydrolase family protein [Microbacterium sp. Root61]|uniref:fumarylacetoacetate hydrolase family protein n=1 Tax=Microbacterium sp. Root61 TaxID=1736570 RepID=UPI001F46411A|nr:fumarylacetoacetate hydrolase family protein [Microbacterium sp. Root61]